MVLQIIHPAMLVMKAHSNQSPTDLCMVLKTIQLAYSSAQIMIYQVINPSTTKSTMHGSLNHSSMHAQAWSKKQFIQVQMCIFNCICSFLISSVRLYSILAWSTQISCTCIGDNAIGILRMQGATDKPTHLDLSWLR